MLSIKNLYLSFGDHTVLNELSLQVEAGTVHGILGRNGAGKTTLFRTITGLLKPQSGTIHWNDRALQQQDCNLLETAPFFYEYLKGREYVQLCNLKHPPFDLEGWNAVFKLPLDEVVDHYSTGMRKKLAFLGLLAQHRSILLLDEPFNGVDLEGNEVFLQVFQRLKESGKTIILASHILDSLLQASDAISYLQKGQIVKTFSASEFDSLETEVRQDIRSQVNTSLDKLSF